MVSLGDSLISHHLSGMWEGKGKRHLWNAYYVLLGITLIVFRIFSNPFEVHIIIPSPISGKTETQRF